MIPHKYSYMIFFFYDTFSSSNNTVLKSIRFIKIWSQWRRVGAKFEALIFLVQCICCGESKICKLKLLFFVCQGFFGVKTNPPDERDGLHFLPCKTFRALKNCKDKEGEPKGIQKMLVEISQMKETLEKMQAKSSTL